MQVATSAVVPPGPSPEWAQAMRTVAPAGQASPRSSLGTAARAVRLPAAALRPAPAPTQAVLAAATQQGLSPVARIAGGSFTAPPLYIESPASSPKKLQAQPVVAVAGVGSPTSATSATSPTAWWGCSSMGCTTPLVTPRSSQPHVVRRIITPPVVTHAVRATVSRMQSMLAFGRYTALEARGRQDLESFAAVWGRVWVVRSPCGELRWLKQMKGDADGLSGNGLREVAILKQLADGRQCPNIIRLTDAFVDSACLHIVCEHVVHDLDTYMEGRRLTPEGVRSLSHQLATAVDHMHSRGILHRGLKPGNVLITPSGRLVVAGFATACSLLPRDVDTGAEYADDFFCCTALCVRPPELLLGLREYGPSVDMWALGCLVATMALSRWVFYADTGEAAVTGRAESSEASMTLAIFRRLGTPRWPHPLCSLAGPWLGRRAAAPGPCGHGARGCAAGARRLRAARGPRGLAAPLLRGWLSTSGVAAGAAGFLPGGRGRSLAALPRAGCGGGAFLGALAPHGCTGRAGLLRAPGGLCPALALPVHLGLPGATAVPAG